MILNERSFRQGPGAAGKLSTDSTRPGVPGRSGLSPGLKTLGKLPVPDYYASLSRSLSKVCHSAVTILVIFTSGTLAAESYGLSRLLQFSSVVG
jgi:hypothetical protein